MNTITTEQRETLAIIIREVRDIISSPKHFSVYTAGHRETVNCLTITDRIFEKRMLDADELKTFLEEIAPSTIKFLEIEKEGESDVLRKFALEDRLKKFHYVVSVFESTM